MQKMILIPYEEYLDLINKSNQKPISHPAPPTLSDNSLFTVNQFADKYAFVNVGGLRCLIFNEKTNGFNKVVKRIGRKVLIDEKAYFEWIDQQN